MSQTSRYASAAEKQKAYRDRKRQDVKLSQLALALLDEAESKAVTLLSMIAKGKDKHRFEICRSTIGDHVKVLRDGYAYSSIETLVFNHLIRTERVTLVLKRWGEEVYHANE